jgi:hypothetical protein
MMFPLITVKIVQIINAITHEIKPVVQIPVDYAVSDVPHSSFLLRDKYNILYFVVFGFVVFGFVVFGFVVFRFVVLVCIFCYIRFFVRVVVFVFECHVFQHISICFAESLASPQGECEKQNPLFGCCWNGVPAVGPNNKGCPSKSCDFKLYVARAIDHSFYSSQLRHLER